MTSLSTRTNTNDDDSSRRTFYFSYFQFPSKKRFAAQMVRLLID